MAHRHGELTLGFPPCLLARLHRTRLYLKPRRLPGVQNLESAAIYTVVANLCNIASAVLPPLPLLDATLYPIPAVPLHDISHSSCCYLPRSRTCATRPVSLKTPPCLVFLSHAHASDHWRVGPARLWFQPSPAAAQSDISLPPDEPLQLQFLLLTSNHGRRNCNFAVEAVDIRQAPSRRTPPTIQY
jgi:hypothetical protein